MGHFRELVTKLLTLSVPSVHCFFLCTSELLIRHGLLVF